MGIGFNKVNVSHSIASGIRSIHQDGISRGKGPTATNRKKDNDWEIIDDEKYTIFIQIFLLQGLV